MTDPMTTTDREGLVEAAGGLRIRDAVDRLSEPGFRPALPRLPRRSPLERGMTAALSSHAHPDHRWAAPHQCRPPSPSLRPDLSDRPDSTIDDANTPSDAAIKDELGVARGMRRGLAED